MRSISREFVRLMGCDIHLHSTVGTGSLFWFDLTLPLAQPRDGTGLQTSEVTGYHGQRQKVLIVEDGDANRRILSELLSGVGFEVYEATNGQEGVEKARAAEPDVIVIEEARSRDV